MRLGTLLYAILVATILALAATDARAQSGQVQGVGTVETTLSTSVRPVVIGGPDDSSILRVAKVTSNGAVLFEGTAADGTSTSVGKPFVIAGKDNSGNVRVPRVVPRGSALGSTGNLTAIGGYDGTNVQAIHETLDTAAVDSTATYRVAVTRGWIGSHANAWNGTFTTGVNGVSLQLDTIGLPNVSAFGTASGATTITLQYSQNGSNFYDGPTQVLGSSGDFAITATTGAKFVRLKSSNNVTVTATLAAKG